MLHQYCVSRNIEYMQCGKLIVATDTSQMKSLADIQKRAQMNGVQDTVLIVDDEAKAMEPHLKCCGALHSPSTGIVDSHGFMLSVLGEAEDHGAVVSLETEVLSVEVDEDGSSSKNITIQTNQGVLKCKSVINCAGLDAPLVMKNLVGAVPKKPTPEAFFCKGSYFKLQGESPFSRLIYPVPEKHGLGVHATIDLGMQTRFGPDTEWLVKERLDPEDYDVDIQRSKQFYQAIRTYWPDLEDSSLVADYSGIRPKLQMGEVVDFTLHDASYHGIPNLTNVFGIESPGLTASLSLAEEISALASR